MFAELMEGLQGIAHLIAITNHSPWDDHNCFYCHCDYPKHYSDCVYDRARQFILLTKERHAN